MRLTNKSLTYVLFILTTKVLNNNMKKAIISTLLSIISLTAYTQQFAIKNNLLYDVLLTPNFGVEFGLGKKITLDINGGYNPFKFSNNKRFKHWIAQPEIRWWFYESFNRGYIGAHVHSGEFNVSGINLPFGMFPDLETHRYQGYFYGGGISVGYQWILSKKWNFETAIGAGYARVHYDMYYCKDCSPLLETGNYNYWGITKATVSFIYIIR